MALRPVNTLLEVDRKRFRLVLWKRGYLTWQFEIDKVYQVAVGKAGYATPAGYYLINSRSRAPEWKMPDSDWVAEEDRGKIVGADDPANPIKARWLGITDPADGVGIHGTADDASIGSAASHGCIRMHVPDVIELFDRVKLHTPIHIS